jgi:hypothetical protein
MGRRGIFISYRRSDSSYAAGRIFDQLAKRYGSEQLFMDVDSIEPGVPFAEVLKAKLAQTGLVLAVIGPEWLTTADEQGQPRLFESKDFVRLELETALDARVRIIPVLVDGAKPPIASALPPSLAGIAALNCEELLHHRFGSDMASLLSTVTKIVPSRKDKQRRQVTLTLSAICGAIAVVGFGLWQLSGPKRLDDSLRALARRTAKSVTWRGPDSAEYNWLQSVFSGQLAQSKERYEYGKEPYRLISAKVDANGETDQGYVVWWPKFCQPVGGCRHDVLRWQENAVLGTFYAEDLSTTDATLNGRAIFRDSDGQLIVWTGERYEKQK